MEPIVEGSDYIPVKYRAWIYRALTAFLGVNTIFGFISDGVAAKVVEVAAVFGFTLASVYTPRKGS